MLEDEPQTPAAIRASIDNVDVIKSLVLAEGIIVEKTFTQLRCAPATRGKKSGKV